MKKRWILAAGAALTLTLCFATTLRAERLGKLTVVETKAQHLSRDIEALRNLAFEGDSKAQFKLAFLYETGKGGFPKDISYAISWYEEAARNGSQAASKKLKSL